MRIRYALAIYKPNPAYMPTLDVDITKKIAEQKTMTTRWEVLEVSPPMI